jgi:hypothetical protein
VTDFVELLGGPADGCVMARPICNEIEVTIGACAAVTYRVTGRFEECSSGRLFYAEMETMQPTLDETRAEIAYRHECRRREFESPLGPARGIAIGALSGLLIIAAFLAGAYVVLSS